MMPVDPMFRKQVEGGLRAAQEARVLACGADPKPPLSSLVRDLHRLPSKAERAAAVRLAILCGVPARLLDDVTF